MKKTETSRYDVAEHLRPPEEVAAYLEACLEEAKLRGFPAPGRRLAGGKK